MCQGTKGMGEGWEVPDGAWDFCPLGNLGFWLPLKSVLELGVAPGDENLISPLPVPSPHLPLGVPGPFLLGWALTLLPAQILALHSLLGSEFLRNPCSREG